ncbi:hypothetical protein BDV38DRAFT_280257 [Aspergillus pseudotamarii]|uniref:Uncharacterized protein n=1 Tax=Aspergillus pseudotamarii TaxID=132259 RepID=A0A5N6T1U4_ASPPS|nr:uncharacterized protein BDV38DRAFT_280257 [Aspergillus pseudotamarii]KAE8140261.1 hypothetical protein BDV38DRAFT_280257 [Aspergillus pseudotamarii]
MSSYNAPRESPEVPRPPESPALTMEKKVETTESVDKLPQADYLSRVKLKVGQGCDIPYYHHQLRVHDDNGLWKFSRVDREDYVDTSKEDFWLFSIHVNAAAMFFLIGGKNPIFLESAPNWNNAFNTTQTAIHQKHGSKYYDAYFELWNERLVAVRVPKATNPAITVWGGGNYAALHWVGLYVKTNTNGEREFIAVNTNKTLLPKYNDRKTVSSMTGADLTGPGRTITLFPKQLFGTKGDNMKTYYEHVSESPYNPLGPKHWESIPPEERHHGKVPSYTWNTHRDTFIKTIAGHDKLTGLVSVTRVNDREVMYNYTTGYSVYLDKQPGWGTVINIFGSLLAAAHGLATGNFMKVIDEIGKLTAGDIEAKGADVKGLITTVVQIVQDKLGKDAAKDINTDGVKDLMARLSNVDREDFGRG